MDERSDRKELERRLEQAKRAVALESIANLPCRCGRCSGTRLGSRPTQIEFGIVALAKRVGPRLSLFGDTGGRRFYNPPHDPLHISNPPRILFKRYPRPSGGRRCGMERSCNGML